MNRDGSKGAGVLMEAKAKRRRFTAECKVQLEKQTVSGAG